MLNATPIYAEFQIHGVSSIYLMLYNKKLEYILGHFIPYDIIKP